MTQGLQSGSGGTRSGFEVIRIDQTLATQRHQRRTSKG
jgi:hypothetical protein